MSLQLSTPSHSLTQWLQSRLGRFHTLVFVTMLAALYLALLNVTGFAWPRILFVTHLGLFLIWQPIIERDRSLSGLVALVTGVGIVVATIFLNAWLLLLWTILLSGVVGGKVLLAGSIRLRVSYLVALAFLVVAVLVLAVPGAVPEAAIADPIRWAAKIAMPLSLLAILVLPRGAAGVSESEVVDLVNSTFLVLLLSVLVLGSLAAMLLFKLDYVSALLQSLFVLSGFLLILGWLWNPHFGYAGLQNVFSRYLLSLGMPAQMWLQSLADLTQREEDPDRFLASSCEELARRVVWIQGMQWVVTSNADITGRVGDTTGIRTVFSQLGIEVRIYTDYQLPPSVHWHVNLLVQLLGEFYADKQRARRLRELSYMRAVHETGARLTHDVKNLLQSLQTLIYAAEQAGLGESDAFRALVRRQLPAISTRLATTLEKLRVPQEKDTDQNVLARVWWERLCQRYRGEAWLTFAEVDIDAMTELPEGMFSAAADNLIANASNKRVFEPSLRARVLLTNTGAGAVLSVCDDGTPVSDSLLNNLFRRPVESATGLGIGLYQLHQLAASASYSLALAANQPANVCFVLSPCGQQRDNAGVVDA